MEQREANSRGDGKGRASADRDRKKSRMDARKSVDRDRAAAPLNPTRYDMRVRLTAQIGRRIECWHRYVLREGAWKRRRESFARFGSFERRQASAHGFIEWAEKPVSLDVLGREKTSGICREPSQMNATAG